MYCSILKQQASQGDQETIYEHVYLIILHIY